MDRALPWREAWQDALYGPAGFYRQPAGPAGHFSTATHGAAGRVLAATLWDWADRLGIDGIVDVGAGRGELLRHLHAAAPDRPLAGLDVVGRPEGLPDAVGWTVSPGGAELPSSWRPARSLVVAHEWLDVVPCTIAEVAPDGSLREVLFTPGSCSEAYRNTYASRTNESLGPPPADEDLEWCQRYWKSSTEPGDRVEVGLARDEAWAGLLSRLDGGAALAVDYGHTAADRPREGTLAAYRSGRQVDPVPDGSCDLTAHVAVDSLAHTRLLRQREAVPAVAAPDHAAAGRDPAGYLAALARRSEVAELRREGGFGDFWWVLTQV